MVPNSDPDGASGLGGRPTIEEVIKVDLPALLCKKVMIDLQATNQANTLLLDFRQSHSTALSLSKSVEL